MARAERLQQHGQHQAAENLYQQILAKTPEYHPALHSLALLANLDNKPAVAIDLLQKAIVLCSSSSLYYRNIGEIYRRSRQLEKAIDAGRQAIKLNPEDDDARYNLGVALSDQREYEAAADCYRQVLGNNPTHGYAWNNLGAALDKSGDKAGAEVAYTKAVKTDPGNAEAQNNLGAIYSEQGKLDEARQCFETAIKVQATFISAHHNLSSLKTYTPNDPHLTLLESLACEPPKQTMDSHVRYYFALGKARQDIGQYDRAFAAYSIGNRLKREQLPYNDSRTNIIKQNIMQVFDADFFKHQQHTVSQTNKAQTEKTPIFIVGMPRSGTTLIEQIISSHPEVYGAGELADLSKVIVDVLGNVREASFSKRAAALSRQDYQQMAESYIQRVWALSPDSAYITDKMPPNFLFLGLIHMMFPHARIIHSMRDPMDSCLSCYARLFNETMDFAYDLNDLGHYYVHYMELMTHWGKVLPKGTILDVSYEDVVADSTTQSRRMLEYIGLPWDESCLTFYKNKRHVKTASIAQVRQPIYDSSVGRWKQFGDNLDPLLTIVGHYRGEQYL